MSKGDVPFFNVILPFSSRPLSPEFTTRILSVNELLLPYPKTILSDEVLVKICNNED